MALGASGAWTGFSRVLGGEKVKKGIPVGEKTKKAYEKPLLTRRGKLTDVTAKSSLGED